MDKEIAERVERLRRHGYRVIHLFGAWYLIRRKSLRYAKFSLYDIRRIESRRNEK